LHQREREKRSNLIQMFERERERERENGVVCVVVEWLRENETVDAFVHSGILVVKGVECGRERERKKKRE